MGLEKTGLMSSVLADGDAVTNAQKDIYVSPSGDDTSTGESTSSQLKTINASLSKINASDIATVHLAKGIYADDGDNMINIDFAHTVYGGSLTFIGEGYNETFIDGSSIKKLFTIGADSIVSFKDISFINAKDQYGAITNNGKLSLENCIFEDNLATTYGGAVYTPSNFGNATLDVKNSVFKNCSSSYSGGAVYTYGSSSFENCQFIDCKGATGSWYYGGAIYEDCYAAVKYLNVLNCEFVNCSAGQGGVIYLRGYQGNVTGTVKNNRFTDCSASSSYDIAYLLVAHMDWTNNTIEGSSSSSAPICSYDGNIFKNTVLTFINEETININEPSISLTATLTDDMGNRITGGKVVFFFNDTQITAGGYNEGTISSNGEASISVTKLLDDGTYTVTGYYNGADNDTATVKNGTAVVSIERTPVDLWISTDGDDDTGNGSEGNPFKTLKKAVNTGFESTISVIVHVKEGTYSGTGNTAVSFSDLGFITIVGDGEDNPVFDGLGTASSMITFGQYTSANVIGITFVNLAKSTSTWSSNTAIKNSASDTTIAFTDCVFQNMNDGLSVYNATIENCKFINATAVVTNSNMEECEFVNCTKTALNLGTSNITNSVFRDNTGGAIIARHNVAMHTGISYTITNCIFENNHAVNGSAITFPTGTMTSGERFAVISDNTFINNTADEIGGAVYLDPSMNMTFKNNRFEDNSAKYGGAIAFGIPGKTNMLNIAGVHIDFINNTLVGNTATDEADAIYGISGRFNAVVVFDNLTTTKLSDDFHATVSDDMGNPVSGGTIRYYLGGVFVGTSDVVNGSSIFHYVGFVDGVYNLTGYYSLQDNDTVSISPAIVNVSIAQSLPSVTLYVGPEGDDENGNGSEANPFKTIKHAYEVGSGLSTNIIIELLEGNITGEGNTHIELSGTVNITINGKGINKTCIDASNLTKKAEFSILINPGGQFFTLSNLTFANGVAKYNQSNQSNWDNNILLSEGNHMYVDHVCFTKNNGNGGGCISNYGTLIVVDSDFFNNGDTLNASAIDNYGYLEINNTSFILNHAKYGTLYNHPAGTMYISNCYFEDDLRTGYMSYFSRIRNEGYASVNDTTFIVSGRNQTEILDIIGYGNMGFGSNNANDRDNPLITIGFYNNKTMIFDNITYIAHTAGVKFNGAKNNQAVWGTNGIPLYFAGNCTVINSRFENIPVLYISNAGFKVYDAETDTNVSYGGLTIENCSFENLGGITVSAAQPSTRIVNHFLLKDNLILFNKSTAQPFNVTWANNAEGELTFVNNWFGNNDPTYYNATSKTFNNCSSWLYLTIDETVAGDLSQGLKLLFKSASVEEIIDEETNLTTKVLVLRDYDGSMYAREFLFESEDGSINPESGEISNSVDVVFSGDGLGNKTLKVTVDDAVVEYTVTLFKESVINVQCDDITYGENATVEVTLTDVDGNIIDETVYMSVVDIEDFELHDGNDSVVLEGYEGGVYIILFQFNGTETYLPSNTIFELVVSPRETVLDAEDISVEIGSGSLNISLSSGGIPLGQKIIEITVNDDSSINASTDENGIVALDLSTYDLGSYDVKAFYAGDNNYTNSTASARVTVTKVLRTVEDLQELINNASAGDTVDLGDYEYRGVSNVNITKDIVLVGNGTIISTAGDKNPVFVIAKDVSSVSISDIEFKANNGDVLVKATATNATSNIAIETPKIEISNNTVVKANDKVVPESIKVLELDSERSILASNNEIKVSDNTLESGVNPFEFRVTSLATEEGIVVPSGGNIPEKLETVIILENMTTFAYQSSVDGDIGDYFYATLQDVNGNPLANKTVKVGLNGKVYTRTTNETGGIGVLMKTAISGRYTFAVSFLGDDNYNASFAVALCTVNKQTPKLSTSSKSYKASAKTKTLSATLKTKAGNPLKGKTLKFTVNGKTYSATTNSKGVASVKVSLSKKRSYSFTVKYAGDSTYASVSKKATLKLT